MMNVELAGYRKKRSTHFKIYHGARKEVKNRNLRQAS
jgi:hypothetical protein